MLRHQAGHAAGFAVGVVVDEDAHDILRAEFVLGGEFAVVARGVNEEDFLPVAFAPLFFQDEEAGGHARAVEDVQRQGDDGVHQTGVEQGLADFVFIIGLAAFYLRIAVVVELAGFLLDLRLAAEKHALRADDAGAAGLREGGEDVEDE